MAKYFKCFVILLVICSLVGCSKEISKSDFIEFSKKCRAQEYYQSCGKFISDAIGEVSISFYYNHDNDILFQTYTMLERCKCDFDAFVIIKNNIENGFNMYEIVSDYNINNITYDIYYVEIENRFYSEFKEFGFIAFNEENYYIDFYWFYDQDSDMSIYDAKSFDGFFKTYFNWIGKTV